MRLKALVIDDDPEIVRVVCDILESLNHCYDFANDQKSARELLGAGKYDYVLLDLEIPVKPRGLRRVENGKNLLCEIRNTSGMENVPIIVMTGHGHDSPDLAVAVMKGGAIDYVKKPFNGDYLDKAIHDAVARGKKTAKVKLVPFRDDTRHLTIGEDSITVCGVEVWRDCGQPDMLETLKLLNRKKRGRFIRMRGSDINRELGRDASNPIARRIKDFRDRCTQLLREEGLDCGKQDIIATGGGGYRFTSWMEVELADSTSGEVDATANETGRLKNETVHETGNEPEAQNETANETANETHETAFEPQNNRQEWILEQLERGEKLRIADIIRGTKKHRSTVNRDTTCERTV